MDELGLLPLSAMLLAVLIVVPALTRSRAAEPKRAPRQVTRWNRYSIDPARLSAVDLDAAVLRGDSDELTWTVLAGSVDALPLAIGRDSRAPEVRIERSLAFIGRQLRLRIGGVPWLKLRPSGDGGFPELLALDTPAPGGAPEVAALELVGDLREREYEIRAADRLVASVSWQHDERGASAQRGLYTLEIVRSVEQRPFAALVLALEACAMLDGHPALARSADTANTANTANTAVAAQATPGTA